MLPLFLLHLQPLDMVVLMVLLPHPLQFQFSDGISNESKLSAGFDDYRIFQYYFYVYTIWIYIYDAFTGMGIKEIFRCLYFR